jgi:Ternary complex associated domain 9
LMEYYCFSPRWAESVKQKIVELIGDCPEQDNLSLPAGVNCKNLHHFYRDDLPRIQQWQGDFPFCYVHGDLNWANVMIDGHDNVWLIDFFHTHHGHLLKDFAKLENDLLYIGTAVNNQADFVQACALSDFLLSVDESLQPDSIPHHWSEQFQRCAAIVIFLRQKMLQYLPPGTENIALQWQLAQLRYAVHTIGFDEPNNLQRCWALYTASCLAEKVKSVLVTP